MSKTRKDYQIRIDDEEGVTLDVYNFPTKKLALAWWPTRVAQFKKDHAEEGVFHAELVEVINQEEIETREGDWTEPEVSLCQND